MGQVIAFPHRRRAQRLAAARTLLLQLGFLIGCFLVIPMAGLMAIKYVAVTQPVGAAACLGLLVGVARLTLAAYRRI